MQDVLGLRSSDSAAIIQRLRDSEFIIEVILVNRFTKRKASFYFFMFPGTGVFEQLNPQVSCIQGPDEQKVVSVQEHHPFYFRPRIYVEPVEGQDTHRIQFALIARGPPGSSMDDLDSALRSLDWV